MPTCATNPTDVRARFLIIGLDYEGLDRQDYQFSPQLREKVHRADLRLFSILDKVMSVLQPLLDNCERSQQTLESIDALLTEKREFYKGLEGYMDPLVRDAFARAQRRYDEWSRASSGRTGVHPATCKPL